MLQNNAWVKDRFQVKERKLDFNLTKYKKYTDMVLDLALQQTIKKLPPDKFWHDIKEYLQLSEKATKILLLLPTIYVWGWTFFIYINHNNILQPLLHSTHKNQLQLGKT